MLSRAKELSRVQQFETVRLVKYTRNKKLLCKQVKIMEIHEIGYFRKIFMKICSDFAQTLDMFFDQIHHKVHRSCYQL